MDYNEFQLTVIVNLIYMKIRLLLLSLFILSCNNTNNTKEKFQYERVKEEPTIVQSSMVSNTVLSDGITITKIAIMKSTVKNFATQCAKKRKLHNSLFMLRVVRALFIFNAMHVKELLVSSTYLAFRCFNFSQPM